MKNRFSPISHLSYWDSTLVSTEFIGFTFLIYFSIIFSNKTLDYSFYLFSSLLIFISQLHIYQRYVIACIGCIFGRIIKVHFEEIYLKIILNCPFVLYVDAGLYTCSFCYFIKISFYFPVSQGVKSEPEMGKYM